MMEFTHFDSFILAAAAMLLGIFLLIKGGDWTIDSSVYIARKFGISQMVVGFTIVAFGTSLPELVISVIANLQGSAGIALGNVIGSNIANILLVLGAAGFLVTLQAQRNKELVKDLSFMVLATIVLAGFLIFGEISRVAGGLMIATLAIYVFLQYRASLKDKKEPSHENEPEPEFFHAAQPYIFLFIGLISIALGAEFLVRGAKISAEIVGVPEAVIALSIIAIGTSLPELSTCIIAARKGQSDIVLGNIIGSNVFNILMIVGVTATVKPIVQGSFAAQLATFDIWLALIVAVIFTALLLIRGKIGKLVGGFFLLSYLVYNIYIYAIYVST